MLQQLHNIVNVINTMNCTLKWLSGKFNVMYILPQLIFLMSEGQREKERKSELGVIIKSSPKGAFSW